MRAFIKENLKFVLAVTAVVICTVGLIGTNEILAQILPDINETALISFQAEETMCSYTGQEIKPSITKISFADEEGKITTKSQKDIFVQKYINNIECGYASVEVSVNGYHGTRLLQNVFKIQPAKVQSVAVMQPSRNLIEATWQEVVGADTYAIYRSEDGGINYQLLHEVKKGEPLAFQDKSVKLNATYMYYVTAKIVVNDEVFESVPSESVTQYTPLATPVITSLKNLSYNTNQLIWNKVDGTIGYQIFRSEVGNTEFKCIAEIENGNVTSYKDTTCKCGEPYSYYMKAIQLVNAEKIYGEQSGTKNVTTLPNYIRISGTTTSDDTAVTLSWKVSAGADGYEIYRSKNSTKNYQLVKTFDRADETSWSESGLEKKSVYYYKLRPFINVNGKKVFGSFSNSYEKVVTIVYDVEGIPDELAQLVKYTTGKTKVQYVWGGTSLSGWDCSGFTQWVFKNHFGISIGRTAAIQAKKGKAISKDNQALWKPGDLLIYSEGAGPSHVAIYLGNGQLIHALSPKYDTLIQDVNYYERWDTATHLIGVRRIFK